MAGQGSRRGCRACLTQAYCHVGRTGPVRMACGAWLTSRVEWLRAAVCEYIEDEGGHEKWVLNDLRACGGQADAVENGQPGAPVERMVAYLYDLLARGHPVGLSGMVTVLGGTSIALAPHAADSIRDGPRLGPGACRSPIPPRA
ncbi:biliverdin-producing heme oxygenase, partial [Pseudomonas syringae]